MNLRAKIFSPEAAVRRRQSGAAPGRWLDSTIRNRKSKIKNQKSSPAFTLIELLVVISIIGILAVIGLPAMRGMTRSNAMIAANRQFLDDLAYARQRAVADHTSVYVVFVPTNVSQLTLPVDPALRRQITNLYTGQFTTYALLSMRQLGDQPGRAVPKYLTGWRVLPNGVFIATLKFKPFIYPVPSGASPFFAATPANSPPAGLPFPVATNYPGVAMPCIEFSYQGQLVPPIAMSPLQDQYIPLARGSIFFDPVTFAADVQENPAGNSTNNYNVVYINALTGRAKILQPQIQ